MTRSIPPALAPLLERLELEQPTTLTSEQLRALAKDACIATPTRVAIQRLAKRGWLLPTGVRGVWEFAPASRAGALSEGDRFLPLRAAISRNSDLAAVVALSSAMYALNLADRQPEIPEIALPTQARTLAALHRSFRVTHFDAFLPPVRIRELPVQDPATVLVHLAHRPNDARSWGAVLENLPALVTATSAKDIRTELRDRPHATQARLAYLIADIAPTVVEQLNIQSAGRVWFGPRGRPRRYDPRWNIADTLLPFSPDNLAKTGTPG
jgi:hypothetical protein